MATDHTRPTDETRAEEAKEAQKDHGAGAAASAEADNAPGSVSPDVADHEKDMAERGADAKGEGRI